jgi:hypothetical protein
MRKTIIALAITSLCVSNAHALAVDFGDGPDPSSGGSYSDAVTITGSRTITFNLSDLALVATSPMPLAQPPTGGNGGPTTPPPATPTEWQKWQDKCKTDCSVAFQIASNTCAEGLAALRYEISQRPYWTAAAVAIIGAALSRSANGALIGGLGFQVSTQINKDTIDNFTATCAAASASDYSWCMKANCGVAGFLPLFVFARRRKLAIADAALT